MTKNNSFEQNEFPCYTQAVERFVKLATEVFQCVTISASRGGLISIRLKSRAKMPNF